MKNLRKETLLGIREQFGGYAWDDAELDELVEPKLGIITGLQDLLEQLEELRRVDLDAIPPAGNIGRE